MSYSIHITKTALKDLNNAIHYIDNVLLNAQAANDLLTEADKKIGGLTDYPKNHQLVDDPVLNTWGIRFVSVKNYLAFYTVDEETATVNIIRFLYGKRNWSAILRQGGS